MAQCEVCGNNYYPAFEVITADNRADKAISSKFRTNFRNN